MVFVHPNPMDGSSWLYQIAHFSTWYRCVTIDLPGYGRSPRARRGVSLPDIAGGCWEALDGLGAAEDAVLVGCSIGSTVVQHMYHLRPQQTQALVVSGAGWRPEKDFAHRMSSYRERGLDYRYDYPLDTFSAQYREGPLAHWFARMFCERKRQRRPGDRPADVRGPRTPGSALAAGGSGSACPDRVRRDGRRAPGSLRPAGAPVPRGAGRRAGGGSCLPHRAAVGPSTPRCCASCALRGTATCPCRPAGRTTTAGLARPCWWRCASYRWRR